MEYTQYVLTVQSGESEGRYLSIDSYFPQGFPVIDLRDTSMINSQAEALREAKRLKTIWGPLKVRAIRCQLVEE